MWVRLVEFPLLLAGSAFAEVRVALGGGLFAEIGHCVSAGNMGYVAALFFWIMLCCIRGVRLLARVGWGRRFGFCCEILDHLGRGGFGAL